MAFVKLDSGILDSSIWIDKPARDLFITALLMATPIAIEDYRDTYNPETGERDDFKLPPGAYGFIKASGGGIIQRAGMDFKTGLEALKRLSSVDRDSRTPDHEGRRMVRVTGGYVVLNFARYRERDDTLAERQRRYRERVRADRHATRTSVTQRDETGSNAVTLRCNTVTSRHVTDAEAEAEAEAEASKSTSADSRRPRVIQVKPPKPPDPLELTEIRTIYPIRSGSQPWDRAAKACRARLTDGHSWEQMIAGARRYAQYCRATHKLGTEYVMQAATFYGPECHFLSPWDAPAGPTAVGKPQPTPEEVQQAREDYERRKAASVASVGIVAANAAPAAQRGPLEMPDLRITRN